MIPLTPAGYTYRILASLPKSKIDRLTPRFKHASLAQKSKAVPGGDNNTFAEVGSKFGVGTITMGLAIIVKRCSSLREVPPV
jgi:hypothetical protein